MVPPPPGNPGVILIFTPSSTSSPSLSFSVLLPKCLSIQFTAFHLEEHHPHLSHNAFSTQPPGWFFKYSTHITSPYFLKFFHDSHFTSYKIQTPYHSPQGSAWSVPSLLSNFISYSVLSLLITFQQHQLSFTSNFYPAQRFSHTFPLPGIPAPATHSPSVFVRLTSSGHRLKVTFLLHLRRPSIFLPCSILGLHIPHAVCGDFVCFSVGSLFPQTNVSFIRTETTPLSLTSYIPNHYHIAGHVVGINKY